MTRFSIAVAFILLLLIPQATKAKAITGGCPKAGGRLSVVKLCPLDAKGAQGACRQASDKQRCPDSADEKHRCAPRAGKGKAGKCPDKCQKKSPKAEAATPPH
ncbi:MAG: hypothetical protein V2A77_08890 [Pseudomonadota bacterium]